MSMAIWYFLFRRHQIIGKLDEGSECVLSEAAFMSTAEQASKTLITSLSWHLTASMNTVSPSLFLSSHCICASSVSSLRQSILPTLMAHWANVTPMLVFILKSML